MADQHIWRNDHEKAWKMIKKAKGVFARMHAPDDVVGDSIDSRAELIGEREAFFTAYPDSGASRAQQERLEIVPPSSALWEPVRFAQQLVFESDDGKEATYLTALRGDAVLGALRIIAETGATFAVIDRVFVVPDYQRRGLAQRLLDAAHSMSNGLRVLVVVEPHMPARHAVEAWLRAAGFESGAMALGDALVFERRS